MTDIFPLHDESIELRPHHLDSAEALFAAVQESAAEVSIWLPDLSPELTLKDVEAYIRAQPEAWANGHAYNFVVCSYPEGDVLGGCGLNQINPLHRYANVYYWVRSSRTGRGAATRSLRLLARFAFAETDLQRLEIVVAPENQASQRVAEKAGAVREGLLRNRIGRYGQVSDAIMYSLIPRDLEESVYRT